VLQGPFIVVRMPANANNGRSRRHLVPGQFARRLSAHVAPIMVPSEAPLNRLDKRKDEDARSSPRNRSNNALE
jgi:hypothetical protein